jgi:hypothetical protein
MLRYYQTNHAGYGQWEMCDETKAVEIAESVATHMTMLSIDAVYPDDEYHKAKYFGDFVIDIDIGPRTKDSKDPAELDEALIRSTESAKLIVDFLATRCNPNHLKIYASGKKGYHIHIPWQLIHPKKTAIKLLPDIYKHLAKRIEVETGAEGIDYSLYGAKKGHMVRIPNKLRPEGCYKVQIAVSDLNSMTPEKYRELCSEARPALQSPKLEVCIGLLTMFSESRTAVEKLKSQGYNQVSGIPDEMLADFGTEDHPECIKRMVHWKHQKPEVHYNQLSVQMAIYLRAAAVHETEQNKLVSAFAENGHSTTYSSSEARKRHVFNAVAPSVSNLQFSCQAMRGVVDMAGGCAGCPVQEKMKADITLNTRIEAMDEGYNVLSEEGVARKLTNFHIEISEFYVPENHTGRLSDAWDGGIFTVTQNGEYKTDIEASRDIFNSSRDFKSAFRRYTYASINVTDQDVEKLGNYLWETVKGKQGMRKTSSIGLRRISYLPDDSDTPVDAMFWIEPGWSISSTGLTGGVHLTGDIEHALKHERRTTSRTILPAYEESLMRLLSCTEPKTVGLILGWVGASQLKEHIMDRVREFPLLHILGIAGSGKTSMARLFAAIGSADYRESPKTAENMTAVPIRQLVYTSTSVPRILDECNKPKIAPAKWNVIREVLKACYQQSMISIGGIKTKKGIGDSHSVTSYNEKATSPVIYLSTSETDEAELWERSVEVRLNKNLHHNRVYKTNFDYLNDNLDQWDNLFAVGRIIMLAALHTPYDSAYEMYKRHLSSMPTGFGMRVQKSFAYIFFGLEFLRNVMAKQGGSQELLDKIDEISKVTRHWMDENLAILYKRKNRNELDSFFERLSQAAARIDHNNTPALRKGVHYIRNGNILYLNGDGSFGEYRATCRWMGQPAEFNNIRQVVDALDGHDYYLGEERIAGPTGAMLPWLKFDIALLEERGNDLSRFEEFA